MRNFIAKAKNRFDPNCIQFRKYFLHPFRGGGAVDRKLPEGELEIRFTLQELP